MKNLFANLVGLPRNVLIIFILLTAFRLQAQHPTFSIGTNSPLDQYHRKVGEFNFKNSWRYHTGDDPQWSAADWDDKDWKVLKLWVNNSVEVGDSAFTGIGWFRMHFEIDSTMMHVPIALSVSQIGALEIYLDGKLIQRLGTVGTDKQSEMPLLRYRRIPYAFEFTPVKDHVLAVRYSNFTAADRAKIHDKPFAEFSIAFKDVNDEITALSDFSNYSILYFLAAIFLTLGLIHMILFLYYKQNRQNLYYSLYSIGLFMMIMATCNVVLGTNFHLVRSSTQLIIYTFPLIPVSLVALLYSIFYTRMLKFFRVLISISVLYMILHFYQSRYETFAGSMIFILSTVEMYRVIVKALIKKKEGAAIFGFGFLYIPVFIILLGIVEVISQHIKSGDFSKIFDSTIVPALTFGALLSISISMTIYLARDFARANKKLKLQISEIETLSEKTILQETEKKRILENQNIELENKVMERTAEVVRQNDELEVTLHNLKSAQDQLVHSEKMASLGQLTAGVAHEINNPINFVSANVNPLKRNFSEIKKLLESYLELLLQSDKKETVEKLNKEFDLKENLVESENLLKGIEEGSRRTAAIVKGLRNFSRLDEEEKKKANVNENIDSTLILLQNKLKHQHIELVKSLGAIPEVSCYPGPLNQVIMNLLSNAIDAFGEKPESEGIQQGERKIYVTTFAEKDSVKISIRDTGSGINEEVRKKIFDPFFTTKDVGKGTGLGLSISYGIIEKHHGKIELNSEVGKGTEFIITLPL